MNLEDDPIFDDEDLTPWERLQVAAMTQILTTGKLTLRTQDLEVLIEYTDRLKQHGSPLG